MYLKRKYQVGGIAYTPYISQRSSAQPTQSSSSSSEKPEKITGTITKEIVDLLKENGIPVDVDLFLNTASGFLNKSRYLSKSSLFGGTDGDYSLTDLIKVQKLANDVKYNKALREDAGKQVAKEYAGSEIALTNTGELYAYDEDGNIEKLSASEYHENRDKYQALTNNQLLYLRDHSQKYAFNTTILDDLSNTIGMQTVMKQVVDTIDKFGSDTLQGYTTKNAQVDNGLKLLMSGGPDGYYKFTEKEELRDVNRALTYLYRGLSDNAKHLLKAKTAAEGGDPTKMTDVTNLLYQALLEHTSRDKKVDFDKQASDYDPQQSGKKGGSSSEQKVQDTYLYRVASLNGPRKPVALAPKSAKISDTGLMTTIGISNGAVVDNKNERLGPMSLTEMLQTAEAVKASDASTIVLGNRVLNDAEYGAVMFDGNTECNTVILPYTYDRGRVVPDFEVFTKFNKLQEAVNNTPNMPKTEVERIARNLGLTSDTYSYDSTKNEVTLTRTMPFLSFGAIVGDDTIDLTKEDKFFLEKIDKSLGKLYVTQYNNIIQYGKIDRKRSDKKIGDYHKATSGDFYRGLIYMAMPDAYRGAHLSMNQYLNKDDMTDFGRRTELREQQVAAARIAQRENKNLGSFAY